MFWSKKVHGEKLLKCPRGHGYMRKLKKENVLIDVCEVCGGMWLDDGELQKLNALAKKKFTKAKKAKKVKKKSKSKKVKR